MSFYSMLHDMFVLLLEWFSKLGIYVRRWIPAELNERIAIISLCLSVVSLYISVMGNKRSKLEYDERHKKLRVKALGCSIQKYENVDYDTEQIPIHFICEIANPSSQDTTVETPYLRMGLFSSVYDEKISRYENEKVNLGDLAVDTVLYFISWLRSRNIHPHFYKAVYMKKNTYSFPVMENTDGVFPLKMEHHSIKRVEFDAKVSHQAWIELQEENVSFSIPFITVCFQDVNNQRISTDFCFLFGENWDDYCKRCFQYEEKLTYTKYLSSKKIIREPNKKESIEEICGIDSFWLPYMVGEGDDFKWFEGILGYILTCVVYIGLILYQSIRKLIKNE